MEKFVLEQLKEKYNFKTGYNIDYLEIDDIKTGTFKTYQVITKIKGQYPDYERSKFGGFIFEPFKWFIKINKKCEYIECENPRKK